MCTRRRQEFCGSAALWPSTRPTPTVSGETTCSPSSHVGPHRLTWTFARVLCQGSEAKKPLAGRESYWEARTYPERTQLHFPTQSCKRKHSNCHRPFVASPKLLAGSRNSSWRSTSSSGAPQPTAQKVPTKSGGSCSSPSAKPKPTGMTSLRICSAVPRIV